MQYIGSNFVTTIKDWGIAVIENGRMKGISLDKIEGFRFAPYFSDEILYSIQSKREGKESSLFANLYENDVLQRAEKSRNVFGNYFHIAQNALSLNFKEIDIFAYQNKHAYSHVYGTHHASPFSESTGICIDYLGYNDFGNHQVQTLWKCSDTNIELLDDFDTTLTLDRGIGFAYSIFSDFFDIYKYDAPYIAQYGDSSRFEEQSIYEYKNGNVFLRRKFLEGIDLDHRIDLLPKTFYASIEELSDNMNIIFSNIKKIFSITEAQIEDSKKDLTKGVIPDLLSHVEKETSQAVLYLAQKAYGLTKNPSLTISGWLASNHLLAYDLVKKSPFQNFFFEISPNYAGISLGAAFEIYHKENTNHKKIPLVSTSYGNIYSNQDIQKELQNYASYLDIQYFENKNTQNDSIVSVLQAKKIVGYFQGGVEYGPRALGNRSILAASDCEDLGDRIRNIKKRQNWKPFSCSVLEEDTQKYFDISEHSPFMSMSGRRKDEYKKDFAGINFDNPIIRYQTVSPENNSDFFSLLVSYKQTTGRSFLLNTSLNTAKQPIAESPKQAIEFFLSTDIDILVLGDFIVTKSCVYPQFAFDYELLRKQKNIEYFACNRQAKKHFSLLKVLLEKGIFKNYESVIDGPKYFEKGIDIHIGDAVISLEPREAGKKYSLQTRQLGITRKGHIPEKILKDIYKRLIAMEKKLIGVFALGDYFLKDLINYL